MDKSNDKADPRAISDAPYAVGNKKPPLHTRFKPGKSGNPSGRPKGRCDFDTTLLKEFYRAVPATKNGKPIKVTNNELFAHSMVKDGITKGPQSKLNLANAVQRAHARLAAEAEASAEKGRSGEAGRQVRMDRGAAAPVRGGLSRCRC